MQRALWLHTGVSPWNSVVVVLLSADVTAYEVLPEVMSIALLLLSAFSPKLPLAITTMVQAQMVKYDAMTFPNGDEQIPHPSMVQTT